jgi:hypothetical protein
LEKIDNPPPEDVDSIRLLKSYLKGGTKERKGTLQNYLARTDVPSNPGKASFTVPALFANSCVEDRVVFSKYPKPLTLRDLPGYYGLIFRHLSTLWRDKTTLCSDVSSTVPKGGSIFNGVVQSFSHIVANGRRFGAMSRPRGRSAQYAYINDRIAVQIQYILRVVQPRSGFNDLVADFAVVRRFQTDDKMAQFPWDLRYDMQCSNFCYATEFRLQRD